MKKKKTLHIRRIREKSQNKFPRFVSYQFPIVFNRYFYVVYKEKKKLLYSFMLSFYSISHDKIQNFLKKFGMLLNFRIKIQRIFKKLNKRLKNKFRKKLQIKYKLRRKRTFVFKLFFLKKFKKFQINPNTIKIKNVINKKKLRLHFSYRHLLHLPVRGQRTKTNAKTRKNYNII